MDRRLMHPLFDEGNEGGGGDDGAAGGGGDGAGGADGGSPPAAADVMTMTLTGDTLPEKLRGKTVKDLLSSYTGAETQIGTHAETIRSLEAAASEGGGPVDKKMFRDAMRKGRATGEIDADTMNAVSENLGIPVEDVQQIIGHVHSEHTKQMEAAQTFIDGQYGEDGEASGISVDALITWAEQHKGYDDADILSFDRMMQRGSVDPFRIIVEDMKKAGVDPTDVQAPAKGGDAAGNAGKLPPPRRGKISQGSPAEDTFQSQAEFDTAMQAARKTGDRAKIREVELKLHRSPVKKWKDAKGYSP